MNNKTSIPFAKAAPPVNLADFAPGTKPPKAQLEKFGNFLSSLANGEKIIAVKCHDRAIEFITEANE